jgi:hypothetical protein
MHEVEYYYATLGIADLMEAKGSIYKGEVVTAATGETTSLETKVNQGLKKVFLRPQVILTFILIHDLSVTGLA